jgi:ribose 5-phosphate isomerase B
MNIAIASDHAGFTYLQTIQEYLESLGHKIQDFGPEKMDPDDDYPDFIKPAAEAVSSGKCDRGIILGVSGQGEAMAANRYKNVRCAVFYGQAVAHTGVDHGGRISHDPYEIIRLSRKHNNSNMLSIGASFTTAQEVRNILRLWLETPFSDDERYDRRNKKLDS